MRIITWRVSLLCAALALALAGTACAENASGPAAPADPVEEQGVQEIQQLLEVSNVEGTDGMNLEELTEAFTDKAMNVYVDSLTGFSMQYPSSLVFDEEQDASMAYSEDRKVSLRIENMQGRLTEEMLLEAIKLEAPDAEPVRYEQNNCIRVDRSLENAARCQTNLYLVAKDSFHHVTVEYPAEDQEVWKPYIEYMINTMETKESEQG